MSGTRDKMKKIFCFKMAAIQKKLIFYRFYFFDFLEFFKNSKNWNLGKRLVPDIDKAIKKTLTKFQVNRSNRTREIVGIVLKTTVLRKTRLKCRVSLEPVWMPRHQKMPISPKII